MSSQQRLILLSVAAYSLFLSFACPALCLTFFWYFSKENAIAATIVLFMFCALIFIVFYTLFAVKERPDSLSKDAHRHADKIAAAIRPENIYREFQKTSRAVK